MNASQAMMDQAGSPSHSTGRKLAITVLCGGPSRERDVSLCSGAEIAVALESLGHDVRSADIEPGDLAALDVPADVVFIALHGAFGEDGQIQAILESRGIRYTGSGPDACARAMNKVRAKECFASVGLPTPKYVHVADQRGVNEMAAWKLPLVVKPVSEGSSIHCSIVRSVDGLRPAVERVVGEYGEALVEEYIAGLELTVGILAERALPAIEICAKSGFYDYQAKYVADDTEYRFDIKLPPALIDDIGRMTVAAHRALGCREFSRVDWRVDGVTHQPYILEVNTIPGFTQHSLLPMAARKAGLGMPELCGQLVEAAMARIAC